MRKLNLTDVFRFSRLVKSSGMKDLIANILHKAAETKTRQKPVMDAETIGKELRFALSREDNTDSEIGAAAIGLCADRSSGDSDLYNIGIDAFLSIVDVAAQKGVETSVYDFLAPVWEMTADEVSSLSLEAVVENLRKMFAENDFAAFFRQSEALTR
ncbi:MAG: hypothetical protein ACI3WQ_09245 [Faecousia sp.]